MLYWQIIQANLHTITEKHDNKKIISHFEMILKLSKIYAITKPQTAADDDQYDYNSVYPNRLC